MTKLTVEEFEPLPERFTVYQNYPNPFNAQTTISYYLPGDANATVTVYDITSRQVETLIDKQQTADLHSVVWDAHRGSSYGCNGVSSGLYFYRIESGKDLAVKKLKIVDFTLFRKGLLNQQPVFEGLPETRLHRVGAGKHELQYYILSNSGRTIQVITQFPASSLSMQITEPG